MQGAAADRTARPVRSAENGAADGSERTESRAGFADLSRVFARKTPSRKGKTPKGRISSFCVRKPRRNVGIKNLCTLNSRNALRRSGNRTLKTALSLLLAREYGGPKAVFAAFGAPSRGDSTRKDRSRSGFSGFRRNSGGKWVLRTFRATTTAKKCGAGKTGNHERRGTNFNRLKLPSGGVSDGPALPSGRKVGFENLPRDHAQKKLPQRAMHGKDVERTIRF